ncbi:MAG: hypothetical protein WBG86_12390 [Polyangiales bacterium]
MRWILTLGLLSGSLVLIGSECSQALFPVISCETSAECFTPCTEECEDLGAVLMSAECDANMFCDCLCMEGDPGSGGSMGNGGVGGSLGLGGAGGSPE